MDSMEMHVWGSQWQWGYHKHPPFPAWIARLATLATGGSPLGIFLASQVCVVTCFWAAWRMGRELVSPRAALLGAMLLECCTFYNYESTILNNNTVLYAIWALDIWFLFRALETKQNRYWAALGVCGGLGMLTKYTFAMLPLSMLAFLIANPQARLAWRRPGPYLAALIAMAVFAPHLYWGYANDFPPLTWAAARLEHESGQWGRLLNPLEFSFSQVAALLPLFLVCLPIAGRIWKLRPVADHERFRRAFLLAMVLGPFALHLVLSAGCNFKLRAIWGSHLWTFAGLLLLFCLNLRIEPRRWRQAFVGCAMVGLLFVGARIGRTVGSGIAGRSSRELFDSNALARQVEEVWRQQCGGPLPIIAGEGWLAGTAAFYGTSQANVYGLVGGHVPPTDRRICPWLDDRQLSASGGVFVWSPDIKDAKDAFSEMRERFPNIRPIKVLEVPYTGSSAPPARIAVAIIPPSDEQTSSRQAHGPVDSRR
jgi:4-amino-4-deoxy-L-arabinose transferase-like glycosyltransferase